MKHLLVNLDDAIHTKFITNPQNGTFQMSDDFKSDGSKMFWDNILPKGYQIRNLHEKMRLRDIRTNLHPKDFTSRKKKTFRWKSLKNFLPEKFAMNISESFDVALRSKWISYIKIKTILSPFLAHYEVFKLIQKSMEERFDYLVTKNKCPKK